MARSASGPGLYILLVSQVLCEIAILCDLSPGDREQCAVVTIGRMREPGFLCEGAKPDHVGPTAGFLAKFPAQFIQETAELDIGAAFIR